MRNSARTCWGCKVLSDFELRLAGAPARKETENPFQSGTETASDVMINSCVDASMRFLLCDCQWDRRLGKHAIDHSGRIQRDHVRRKTDF